jgi:histidinol-phosphate aminotransferase
MRENRLSRYWSDIVHHLTPYVPGEQPVVAHPVKLNTNENPYPPSPRVLEAIRQELGDSAESLRRYPDPTARKLRETVAAYHGIHAEQVFAGNGSDEVLALTFQALLKHDKPLLFPDITYSFYPTYARLFEVDYQTIPLDDSFAINVDDYASPNGGILFPNPNAPTGRQSGFRGGDRRGLCGFRRPIGRRPDRSLSESAGRSDRVEVALAGRHARWLCVRQPGIDRRAESREG